MKASASSVTTLCALLVGAFCTPLAQAEEAAPPQPAAAEKAPSGPKLARGLLMKQGGKLVLAPCRDRSYAFVEDVSAGQAVTGALRRLGLDEGKKLYVELWTTIEGVILRADEVNFARTEGRCQPPATEQEAWQAAGQTPQPWNLSAGGGKLVVYRTAQPELKADYTSLVDNGNVVKVDLAESTKGMTLEFTRGLCYEPSGQAVFGWSASLQQPGGESLKGCAWQR